MTSGTLVLLGISDTHGVLTDWDYVGDAPAQRAGSLARVATAVRTVRAERPPVLLLDVGDSIQGTPMMSLVARERLDEHPVADVLNLLELDAAAMGNHELNYGPAVLEAYARRCRFPVLAANYDGLPWIGAWTIREVTVPGVGQVRVGVIGLSTPGSLVWDAARLGDGVRAEGIVERAAATVPLLEKAGAEIVVALSHAGLGPSSTYGSALPWPENDTARLIEQVPGIDAVLLGHTHLEAAGHLECGPTGQQIPYAQPFCYASRIARIDLQLAVEGDDVRVVASSARIVPVDHLAPDPAVVALARPWHDRTRRHLDGVVGNAAEPIPAWPLDRGPSPAIDLVNQVQAARVEQLLHGTASAGVPVIAATAMATPHDGLTAGELRIRDLHRMYRFDNRVHAVPMTARELVEYLEHSALYYGPDPVPAYNLDGLGAASHDIAYRVDPEAPPGGRISGLLIDGHEPPAEYPLVLALSDYRASGGGGFPGTAGKRTLVDAGDVRDLLAGWLGEHRGLRLDQVRRASWSVIGSA